MVPWPTYECQPLHLEPRHTPRCSRQCFRKVGAAPNSRRWCDRTQSSCLRFWSFAETFGDAERVSSGGFTGLCSVALLPWVPGLWPAGRSPARTTRVFARKHVGLLPPLCRLSAFGLPLPLWADPARIAPRLASLGRLSYWPLQDASGGEPPCSCCRCYLARAFSSTNSFLGRGSTPHQFGSGLGHGCL